MVLALTEFMEGVSDKLIEPAMHLGSTTLLGGTATMATRIIDGYCGLVPEAHTAMCSVLKSATSTATDLASEQVVRRGVRRIKQKS